MLFYLDYVFGKSFQFKEWKTENAHTLGDKQISFFDGTCRYGTKGLHGQLDSNDRSEGRQHIRNDVLDSNAIVMSNGGHGQGQVGHFYLLTAACLGCPLHSIKAFNFTFTPPQSRADACAPHIRRGAG